MVTKSSAGTADEATKASWRVDDLAAEVADLRSRGVEILDLPDLNTVDGIADVGFAFAACSSILMGTLSAFCSSRWT